MTAFSRCFALVALVFGFGCAAKLDFDPPAEPPHTHLESDWVDGEQVSAAHASGMSTPYLCPDPDGGGYITCPEEPMAPQFASCDAAGCHGGFTYVEGADDPGRHLDGSDGPSCWTCHDREWSSRTSP